MKNNKQATDKTMKVKKRKGFVMVDNEFIRSQHISPRTKAVAMILMSRNPSFAGYKTLVKESGVSRGTLSKITKELEERNIIIKDGRSKYRTTNYIFQDKKFWNLGLLGKELFSVSQLEHQRSKRRTLDSSFQAPNENQARKRARE